MTSIGTSIPDKKTRKKIRKEVKKEEKSLKYKAQYAIEILGNIAIIPIKLIKSIGVRRDGQISKHERKLVPTAKFYKKVEDSLKRSPTPKELMILNKFVDLLGKQEVKKLRGTDFPNTNGKLPGSVKTAMWCIIREGPDPADIPYYFREFIEKSTKKPVIYEDMDIYLQSVDDLDPLTGNTDQLISTILAHRSLMGLFYSDAKDPSYYGVDPDKIKYSVFSDHTNSNCLSYSSYRE